MRIRALLFIPALAAAALGIGASGASAATLFTTAAHTTRVTIGATADATSVGPVDFTSTAGALVNRCTHASLNLRVDKNDMTNDGTVGITVTSGTVALGCVGQLQNASITTTPSWQLTITGAGSVVGTNTVYAATVHNVQFDVQVGLTFTGNLETGVTASQPTVGTAPICVNAAAAGTVVADQNGLPGTLDARFCLTGGAVGWSLTT